ncbi:DUF1592 domain-containing protein [Chthoniobacter flavus]|uniref:DUF1592 domain-containing protein n=1 Tax=Chthoniobacter flavus TaxID=191863 RepID=UPI001FB4CE23|nr:DUF1592 domain-containing protein [Chthoniobacter flavus]
MPRTPTRFCARVGLALPLVVGMYWCSSGSVSAEESDVHKTGSEAALYSGAACIAPDNYFLDEVWTKVAAQACLKCHKVGGDAEDTKLVLEDPTREKTPGEATKHNRAAFADVARLREKNESRLLLKATGGLDHEGKQVIKADSTAYRILAEWVRQVNDPHGGKSGMKIAVSAQDTRSFFDGVAMLDNRKLMRRITLSLAGRLPSEDELAAAQKDGVKAVGPILDKLMKEDAFYDRLAEAFNDIFLTRGYDGVPETALSYDNFEKTRNWCQKYDLKIEDKAAQQKARYKLTDDYREAMLREPTELIKYIVRNERPFTEIVTADYIMVSPYTARGYGVYDEMREKFHNPEDPFEYLPVRLSALKHRNGKVQESATSFYPHAGLLTTFQYLRRYPTTETNRNRLRARMYFQFFLGIDVLELAPRVSDAAAITAKFKVPTMEASECVICHKTIDPIAGLFQDYYDLPDALFGPRKDGWFKDMFVPGFEGENLPPQDRWRALQWLGERTAKDPRFATTMVEHVYFILTGRKTLLQPKSLDDPLYDAKQRAYRAQRAEVERIASVLVKNGFNLKVVFKEWVASPFYRADTRSPIANSPNAEQRQAEMADLGIARMLSPEQLERKITAVFGKPWNRLRDKQIAMLYGGIDSKEVTERAVDPSGAMGALQRIMSNDVACKEVSSDFALEPTQRRLFPGIKPDVLPGVSTENDQRIRAAIVHLHQLLLGQYDIKENDPEVDRTFQLFAGILEDAHARKGIEPQETYNCRGDNEKRLPDPDYTVRAWRGVVTYLLRQEAFLYE